MFASHATNQGCLVTSACLTTASSNASCLGVQPSECQKHTEKPANLLQRSPMLGRVFLRYLRSNQSPLLLLPLLLSATKTPTRRVLAILAASCFICDSRCIRRKSPSFRGLYNELLLHFLLEKISHFPFLSSHVLPLCAPHRPIEQCAPQ